MFGQLEQITKNPVLVELVVTIDIGAGRQGRGATQQVLEPQGRVTVGRRVVLTGVLACEGVVLVGIGVQLVVGFPASAPTGLGPQIVHVRLFGHGVVAKIALAIGLVVHRVVFAQALLHLQHGHARGVVGHIAVGIVQAGEESQQGGIPHRAGVLQGEVVVLQTRVSGVALGAHVLQVKLQGGVRAFHVTRLMRYPFDQSVPAAERAVNAGFFSGRGRFGIHVDAATVSGIANVGSIAGATLNHHAAHDGGGKIGGGVVGRAVGVTKRNAVKRDVEVAIGEAAHDDLLIGHAGAIGRRHHGHAGGDGCDGGVVASGGGGFNNEFTRNDGHGLRRIQAGLRRGNGLGRAFFGIHRGVGRSTGSAANRTQVNRVGQSQGGGGGQCGCGQQGDPFFLWVWAREFHGGLSL